MWKFLWNLQKRLQELVNDSSNVVGYQVNTQKQGKYDKRCERRIILKTIKLLTETKY